VTTSPARHGTLGDGIKGLIARHPISAYLVIAFASSWSLTVLVPVSIMFGLLALFGPALGAVVVSWADGTTGELSRRTTHWRESPRSYLSAFGVPFAVTAAALVVYALLGNPVPGIGSIGAIEVLIFVLVIGEEIGWRGFLMPRLRARMSLPAAGLVTGVIWTTWHLPIYLAPNQGLTAFVVFAWWVVPFAVVMGFVVERARYSVVVATAMHGAANIAMPILLPSVDHTWTMVATGTVYLVLAISLVVYSRSRSAQSGAPLFAQKEVAA
jgi:membrane protease YdiL (CAAX protease family)